MDQVGRVRKYAMYGSYKVPLVIDMWNPYYRKKVHSLAEIHELYIVSIRLDRIEKTDRGDCGCAYSCAHRYPGKRECNRHKQLTIYKKSLRPWTLNRLFQDIFCKDVLDLVKSYYY